MAQLTTLYTLYTQGIHSLESDTIIHRAFIVWKVTQFNDHVDSFDGFNNSTHSFIKQTAYIFYALHVQI